MDFWKTGAIAEKLAANSLSQTESFKYLLCWVALIMVGSSQNAGSQGFVDLFVEVAYTVGFLSLCFKANSQGDGQCFLERLICLSWPEVLKLGLCSILVSELASHYHQLLSPWLIQLI